MENKLTNEELPDFLRGLADVAEGKVTPLSEIDRQLEAACLDCGLPYEQFGMDLQLPRSQWLLIPPEENGLLSACGIVKRAAKLKGACSIQGVIEIAVGL